MNRAISSDLGEARSLSFHICKEPTVKRDNKIDGPVGGPFLDLADIGSQSRLIHGAVKDLASGRHGGEVKCRSEGGEQSYPIQGNWK